ncbi:MAG: S-methyl-5'-thioadenosine phosphorylase [Cyanobacteria bacterium P01_H01_bin.74]
MSPFNFEPSEPQAEIGVFGGSGFYDFIDNAKDVKVETPYGLPSDSITIGTISGKQVAFLPRHGKNHTIPPHKINYRANVWAFKALGVKRVVCPCAAGSLQTHIKPGEFVFCDQFVDRTSGRIDTFFDGPITTHVSAADPYAEGFRKLAVQAAESCGIAYHNGGTVVVIQGPRFSTRSESKWFRDQGWEVINMTQYPEAHLVKELEMDPLNISLITDYDTGVDGVAPVSHAEVIEVFTQNNVKLRKLLFKLIELLPASAEKKDNEFANVLVSARHS